MYESEQSFTKELTKLNPAQRDAVENIDGPVMVVAGPGTGNPRYLHICIKHPP